MIRFKTFNIVTCDSFDIDSFTKKVNSWLDSYIILDVQRTMDKSVISNWRYSGIETSLSYIIKYDDAGASIVGNQ